MTHRREFLQFIPAAAALCAAGHVSVEAQSQAPPATPKGGATTPADLLRSRAIEAMIWGMPICLKTETHSSHDHQGAMT